MRTHPRAITAADAPKSLLEMPFGEYLVQVRALSREQLFQALHFKDLNPSMRIGDCIVTLRYLSGREIELLHRAYADLDVVEIELDAENTNS